MIKDCNQTMFGNCTVPVVENIFYDVSVGVDYSMGIIQGGVGVPWAIPGK